MNDIRFEMFYGMFLHTKSVITFDSFFQDMQIQNYRNGFSTSDN